jgi:hypothetical protein
MIVLLKCGMVIRAVAVLLCDTHQWSHPCAIVVHDEMEADASTKTGLSPISTPSAKHTLPRNIRACLDR